MRKRKFTKFRKSAIAALCALAVTCTGLAAACAPEQNDDTDSSTSQREDTQLLKNGDFEFSDVPEKAVHLIKNVNSWTRSGDSSGVMSGIINTSSKAWELISDTGLKAKLDANNDLKSDDADYEENYVDYNGMDSGDILYIDSYAAAMTKDIGDDEDGYAKDGLILKGKVSDRSYKDFIGVEGNADSGFTFRGEKVYFDADSGDYYFDEAFTEPVRYAVIDNPETHLGSYDESSSALGTTSVYLDDNGNYYLDEAKTQPTGNVLMIHNYPTGTKYNGIEQHYSSQTITLEANTAAEISLWVKTSDLKYDKGYLQADDQDRGAYIEVVQNVASTSLDPFRIEAINTEKIIKDNSNLDSEVCSNGWLKYTIYVNACDFADSTISINLGLGGNDNSDKVTGYAFFDDVQVKKIIDLKAKDSDGENLSTYPDNVDELGLENDRPAYCSLTSEAEDKIFCADAALDTSDGTRKIADTRFSQNFYYMLDLASENYTSSETSQKVAIPFNSPSITVSAALTTEKSSGKVLASAETNDAKLNGGVESGDSSPYSLPNALKNEGGRPTFNDLIGIYGADAKFTAADFTGTGSDGYSFLDLSPRLNSALTGDNGLKALEDFSLPNHASMLVTLSRFGAAYTTTIGDFTIQPEDGTGSNYKIISLWVKTSDMNSSTAATIRLVDADDDDNSVEISVDTTDVKTKIGDDKDIYKGWVQCFFFVKNELDTEKTYKLEFSFGNTNLSTTTGTSYKDGWAAIGNLQSLEVSEDIFKLVSEGTYAKTFTFGEEDNSSKTPFDESTRMNNVKKEVGTPSTYYGVNGGSSYVTDKAFGDDYDKQNNVKDGISGLINRDGFDDYDPTVKDKILKSFSSGAASWNDVFGEECYQPLIIVNSLREYYDRATETDDYIKEHIGEFFVKDGDNYIQATEWNEDETYYSAAKLAKNYGYIGSAKTLSANSYTTVSLRVMVSKGAEAYVYLVNSEDYGLMDLNMPAHSFYYDGDGNVLSEKYDEDWSDSEHRAAIVYKLRDDGLYDGDDGVYANLSNLTCRFKYPKFEKNTFYKDGELVSYDNLVDVSYNDLINGKGYYSDQACTKIADHYLCVDAQRVYEYDGDEGNYYYLVNGERGQLVKPFDDKYEREYGKEKTSVPEYSFEIGPTLDNTGKPQWVNVNFVIHTGSAEKSYRLELWSGKRGETGAENLTIADKESVTGAVAFDYSAYSITENDYSSVLEEYESSIKDLYVKLIAEADASRLSDKNFDELNINELQKIANEIVDEAKIEEGFKSIGLDSEEFVSQYYTFSWYDSSQYVPFNSETAEVGQTGYEYDPSSYSETLVYFKAHDIEDNSYNMYVDYSAIDQTISISSETEDNDDDENTTDTTGESPWLLITSIILVVVLIFALAAILFRQLWKKYAKTREQKNQQKNNYKKRERYIRKLKLVKTAPVEEEPVENEPSAETDAEPTDETDDNSAVEETSKEPSVENAVEEQNADSPVENEPSAETDAEPANETDDNSAVEEISKEPPVESAVEEQNADSPVENTENSDDKKDE